LFQFVSIQKDLIDIRNNILDELNGDGDDVPVEQPVETRKRKSKSWQTDDFPPDIQREIEHARNKTVPEPQKKTKKVKRIIIDDSMPKINGADVLGHGK
jgi:hypothetical protein